MSNFGRRCEGRAGTNEIGWPCESELWLLSYELLRLERGEGVSGERASGGIIIGGKES